MKNGLVIADSGPIFSLATINKLDLLTDIFDETIIPRAVWKEITCDESTLLFTPIAEFFKDKIRDINGFNELSFIMDYGESESVILYKETRADFLLIDDKKARKIAENFDIRCIGTLGLLLKAKNIGVIDELKPIFNIFLENKRYYSLELLNQLLIQNNESPIEG